MRHHEKFIYHQHIAEEEVKKHNQRRQQHRKNHTHSGQLTELMATKGNCYESEALFFCIVFMVNCLRLRNCLVNVSQ